MIMALKEDETINTSGKYFSIKFLPTHLLYGNRKLPLGKIAPWLGFGLRLGLGFQLVLGGNFPWERFS